VSAPESEHGTTLFMSLFESLSAYRRVRGEREPGAGRAPKRRGAASESAPTRARGFPGTARKPPHAGGDGRPGRGRPASARAGRKGAAATSRLEQYREVVNRAVSPRGH
jgi:hypothetical protein